MKKKEAITFYQKEVIKLNKELYPKDYLPEQVIQAKKYMDKNFSKNISLEDIAGQSHFSKFHFLRLFKTFYGRTPRQYLTLLRIAEAKRLLKKNKSISQTCYEVGFSSISSFSGLFKRITGYTPAVFIRRQKKK